MLLYNYKKEFLGIDENDLNTLGFSDLAQLRAEADDFADMFVKKPGFIHNFKHVNWIDFVECADSLENAKVIINANAKNFQCYMSVETMYLTSDPSSKAFMVHLNNIMELSENETEYISVDLLKQSTPKAEPKVAPIAPPRLEEPLLDMSSKTSIPVHNVDDIDVFDTDTPLELDFDDEEDAQGSLEIDLQEIERPKEIEKIEIIEEIVVEEEKIQAPVQKTPKQETTKVITQTEVFDNGYIFDPSIASSELGLPVDLIEEFIEDFIAQAKEFKSDLYSSLENGDIDNLKILSHKLKGVAANLRIVDALESLTVVNTSETHSELKDQLDLFYKIISKLSGEKITTTKTITTQVAEQKIEVEPIAPIEDISLDDDDLDIFAVPTDSTPQPEVIKLEEPETIEELELDFKLEIDEPATEEKLFIAEIDTQEFEEDEPFALEIEESNFEEKEDFQLEIEDSEVPSQIDMPELADDSFFPEEEDTSSEIETIEFDDIQLDTPSEEIKAPPYDKENVANEIGLDLESFNELFQDYIEEAQEIAKSISTAIATENISTWKHQASRLQAMSANMMLQSFSTELDLLIQTEDTEIAKETNSIITEALKKLSSDQG